MKRWNAKQKYKLENVEIDAFLKEIIAICEKHKLAICHSDKYGTFEIREYTKIRAFNLQNAHDFLEFDG